MNSGKSATKSGLVGRYLTVLDLQTYCPCSCRLVCGGPRQFVNCWGSPVPRPIRNCHENHLNRPPFKRMAEIDSAPRLNAVSRDRKSASVWRADVPTSLTRFDPDKKICTSASARWPHVSALDSAASAPGSSPACTLCCVLGQDTLLSRCLSAPRCINGYRQI